MVDRHYHSEDKIAISPVERSNTEMQTSFGGFSHSALHCVYSRGKSSTI